MSFQMFIPTKIYFGRGQLEKLHKRRLPGKKALVVISSGRSVRENGSLGRLTAQLELAGLQYSVFDRVAANPLRSTVMEGAAMARREGCDMVAALGGGSVMDAAKAIAVMAVNDGDVWDYVSGGTGGGKKPSTPPLPLIAITTTAGTGSEVDQWGVISNEETNEKIGFGGWDFLFPAMALVDPELTLSVPPRLTAFQGFDALFHCAECYISAMANPMGDMYALTGMENIGRFLPRAVDCGTDMEAREAMAFAAALGGAVMTLSACTSEHSMEHAMSALHHTLPHGAGLIMISLEYYKYFIEKNACGERFVAMARALGMESAQKPEDFLTALEALQRRCGVDGLKMSDYGIGPDECGALAKKARDTMGGLFKCDPVPLSDEDCAGIFRRSWR